MINFIPYSNYYIVRESFKVFLPEHSQNLSFFSGEMACLEFILTQVPDEC